MKTQTQAQTIEVLDCIHIIDNKKIAVTGHRPHKLWRYNLSHPAYTRMKDTFKELMRMFRCEEGISGMALGVDTVFALAVIELRDEGFPVKLHCAVPCLNHSSKWNTESQEQYQDILNAADTVHMVSDEPYTPYCMEVRNRYMVDRADMVIAVWDGSPGGTANCVKYAEKKNKFIWNILQK